MLISTFETIFLLSSPICQQMILLCHIYFLGNIPSDGVVLLADDALSHVCDFPTSFHLPSRRSIRRRLLTQSAGIIFVVLIFFSVLIVYPVVFQMYGISFHLLCIIITTNSTYRSPHLHINFPCYYPNSFLTKNCCSYSKSGFPHPDPITAAQSCRKRKLSMAAKSSRGLIIFFIHSHVYLHVHFHALYKSFFSLTHVVFSRN